MTPSDLTRIAATLLQQLVDLINALDVNLVPENGDDGFIAGYRMKTGYWHKIIALVRSDIVADALARLAPATPSGGATAGDQGAATAAELREAKLRAIAAAARAFVDKTLSVEADDRYIGIWQMAAVHGARYFGPKWVDERDALLSALAALDVAPASAERSGAAPGPKQDGPAPAPPAAGSREATPHEG